MKKINKQLPSVTVAVCALNEQDNIGKFLESIFVQEERGFKLKKILVISDGSTDNTVKIVKSLRHPKVVLRAYKSRKGKSFRLNEIYHGVDSDYLVLGDADVQFAHPLVIHELLKPFVRSEKIGLVGGNPIPLKPKTFIEKAIQSSLNAYIPLRKELSLKNGHNVLSATGRVMVLKKKVARKIQMPHDTISNDGFTYFFTLHNGYLYRYAAKATVYFRSPQSFSDHLSQSTRFLATKARMKMYYPSKLVDQEYHIPSSLIAKRMLIEFLKDPLHAGVIFVVNKYCQLRANVLKTKINAIWKLVYTTKKLT